MRKAVEHPEAKIRRNLLDWYHANKRDLPWRRTQDPYRIWVSEIMLQQTRVAAVIPYYERFLRQFPTVERLAEAPEQEVLTYWSGLGYYSRARNLQKAAKQIHELGSFPATLEGIRALAGVGDYTAAAVGSIAFGLPTVVLDGNVARVMSRLNAEPGDIGSPVVKARLRDSAQALLDREQPGAFNQALMELGATVCLPRDPQCLICPLQQHCSARRQNRQSEFPVKLRKARSVDVARTLLLVEGKRGILVWQRPPDDSRMAGFWELPEPDQLPQALLGEVLGTFRHTITIYKYRFTVVASSAPRAPKQFEWKTREVLSRLPLSTIARKALNLR
ncbi:MAG: A/G-specific adenine glycosylase [Bryobacteraceae bacterium]